MSVMFSKKALDSLKKRTIAVLQTALPANPPDLYTINPLPEEIAHRVVMNAMLVVEKAELRDQILIVLADYRDHLWTGGKLAGEGTRQGLARQILTK
jgi:hypothetical protein